MGKAYYMRDNHTFLPLPIDIEGAMDALYLEFCEGDAFGMLCTKDPGLQRVVHANGDWESFRHEANGWLTYFKMINESSTSNEKNERAKFEAWLKGKGHRTDRDHKGDYVFSYAASTWSGWLARSKQEKS